MPVPVLAQAQQALVRLDLAEWLGMFAAVAAAVVGAWLVSMLALRALGAMTRRTPSPFDDRLLRTAAGPLRLALFALFFSLARRPIELSKASTALFATLESTLLVIAGFWQVVRLLDVLADDYRRRFQRRGQGQAGSMLALAHRSREGHGARHRGDHGARQRGGARDGAARRRRAGRHRDRAGGAEVDREPVRRRHAVPRSAGAGRTVLPLRRALRRGRGDRPALHPRAHAGPHARHGAQRRIRESAARELRAARQDLVPPDPGAALEHAARPAARDPRGAPRAAREAARRSSATARACGSSASARTRSTSRSRPT